MKLEISSNWRVRIAALLTTALLTSGGLLAIARQPLPAVTLTTANGAAVVSSGVVQPGRWLLVLVGPDCRTCERVLATVRAERDPSLAEHMVILVGGPAASVTPLSSRFPDLARATWLADPDRRMAAALHLPGTPVILGLSGPETEWSITGVPRTVNDVLSAMRSWIAPTPQKK